MQKFYTIVTKSKFADHKKKITDFFFKDNLLEQFITFTDQLFKKW